MSRLTIITLFTFSILFISCTENYNYKNTFEKSFTLKVFQINKGYGYAIYFNDSLQIKQEFIPGISGNHFFKTRDQAQKIGALVIAKISNGEDPTIFKEELLRKKIDLK
ncbi:MAG: DUF4907 domain-containing protein [Flavobacteriaceae bacterium]|nr:DUF4907 domain-containing protein [Flavobacteriaceae bacterium]